MKRLVYVLFFCISLPVVLCSQNMADSAVTDCHLLKQNFRIKKVKLISCNDSLIHYYQYSWGEYIGKATIPTAPYLGIVRGSDTTFFPKFQFLNCKHNGECKAQRQPLLFTRDHFYMASKLYPLHKKTFKRTILSLNDKDLTNSYTKYKKNKLCSNISGISAAGFAAFSAAAYITVVFDEILSNKLSSSRPYLYIGCAATGTSIITYTITTIRKRHFRRKMIERYNKQINLQ